MLDFTTVVAVDREHVQELRTVWPTWRVHRPEILQRPLLCICDAQVELSQWQAELAFLDHSQCTIAPWTLADAGQREKMLTGFVLSTAEHVRTRWYLKLDTDVVAQHRSNWLDPQWFVADDRGRLPVFVTSPWGYTKPPDAIDRLDAWAAAVRELQGFEPLNLHPAPGAKLVSHRRIISWCFFGQTAWTREVAGYCQGRLPVPSQDTYLWYCAARRGDFFRRVRMARYGWAHLSRFRRLREACERALSVRHD